MLPPEMRFPRLPPVRCADPRPWTKACSKCRIVLPLSKFALWTTDQKGKVKRGGTDYRCRVCRAEEQRLSYWKKKRRAA